MSINHSNNGHRPQPDQFEALVREHQAALLRYAVRVLRDHDQAQDVVQEVFMRYLQKTPAAQGRQLSNWLYRVTHNLCIDLIRKESRMRDQLEQIESPPPVAPPSRKLEREELRDQVGGLLDRLTERQRTVVILKVFEDKTYREISEITGLSVSNVGFHIYKGLKKLAGLAREAEVV